MSRLLSHGEVLTFDQCSYAIRCEWGLTGAESLAPISDVVVIVDVMSFTTCVDVAVSRGATVYPYRWRDQTAVEFARRHDAILAGDRGRPGAKYSLSPASLAHVQPEERIVLPSPNGSTLSLVSGEKPTFAGCLRNACAVAAAAASRGETIAIIPAGERWPDGSLRPAIEDLIGAGAIIGHLSGCRSPEAEVALAAFKQAEGHMLNELMSCSSGRELAKKEYRGDVKISAAIGVSTAAPLLTGGAYVDTTQR